jgi:hypothetical protein
MGATNFQTKERGKSMSDAYQRAVEDAINEYGNDSYNGTISTTRGVEDKTQFFKSSKLSIQEFVNKYTDSCLKWGAAWGVCIEEPQKNKLKVKSKVNNIVSKGTKKWELVYDVILRGDVVKCFDNKMDAVKYARKWVEDNGGNAFIDMRKRLVGGNPRVAEITYKTSGEKLGLYVFFGIAAE